MNYFFEIVFFSNFDTQNVVSGFCQFFHEGKKNIFKAVGNAMLRVHKQKPNTKKEMENYV